MVLKPLDDDCLLDGDLHPSIRLRLSRIRELPMTAVANLHGVERIDGEAFLIWDYIEGRTLEELSPSDRASLAREVHLVVETLHSRGIVHGALHAHNIIIDNRNHVHLTHLSPLLHTEPAADLEALARLFSVGRSMFDVECSTFDRSKLRTSNGERPTSNKALNCRALLSAAVVLAIGLLITLSILYFAVQPS